MQTYQLGNGPFSAEVNILPVRDLPGGGTEAVTIPAGWVITFNLSGGQIVTSVGSAGTFTQSGSLVTITGTEPIAVTSNNYDYGFSMTYTGTMLSGYSFSGRVRGNGVIASS